MQITLIGQTEGHAVQRLQEEALKMGATLSAISIDTVVFSVQNNTFSLFDEENKNLMKSDCYIFRGIGDADQEVMVIAKYLLQHGATVIEGMTAHGALLMDKLFLGAIGQSVPTLNYFMVQSEQTLRIVQSALTYPVVMKATIGSMGMKVQLVRQESELAESYQAIGPRVILQEYLPVDHDYRAIVIGGKYIGAYRRERTDGEFRMNVEGNTKAKTELPLAVISICEQAAQQQNIEIAGIDLLHHDNKWYVLEINTSPQFKYFESITGQNIAQKIIQYAITKIRRKTNELRE
ncbi:MAG: ATP-grasp domain-containing protein [Candidatus Paceibacterota bacterium]